MSTENGYLFPEFPWTRKLKLIIGPAVIHISYHGSRQSASNYDFKQNKYVLP